MKSAPTRRSALAGAVASATALALGLARQVDAAPFVHDVRITRFAFDPARVQVRVGDTIRWRNEDLAPHTATANDFGWDTGEMAQGDVRDVPVTADMETVYFCVFHSHMMGKLEIL
ncbi:copper-binding protein [Sulfitobacter sp. JB4-11]|uniref:copper-binding protein n=1 Tax=Sulfitobacter rhodophyticola TaxID=3238304 RepID=UPI003517DBCB